MIKTYASAWMVTCALCPYSTGPKARLLGVATELVMLDGEVARNSPDARQLSRPRVVARHYARAAEGQRRRVAAPRLRHWSTWAPTYASSTAMALACCIWPPTAALPSSAGGWSTGAPIWTPG